MSIGTVVITAGITAVLCGPAGYYVNVWWPRHQGTHSDKDRHYPVSLLIAEVEDERAQNEAAHTEQVTATDADTQLLASDDLPVLCGGYGRTESESDWLTEQPTQAMQPIA